MTGMKYCPTCERRFYESWLSFCSDDGTPLVPELSPSNDPDPDPRIRETQVADPSEEKTQWLPREPPSPGGWIAPDERPPMAPGVWQPPPPPYQPSKQPSQSLAVASLVTSILGLVTGGCFGPLPGLVGLILGSIALSQIKKSPDQVGGKPFATAGVVIGAITVAFYFLLIFWFLLAFAFG